MTDYDAYIGLDVHKESISVAIADAGRSGEVRLIGTIPNEPDAISKLVKKLSSRHRRLEFVYEASPCGYNVFRQIEALGLLTFVEPNVFSVSHVKRAKPAPDVFLYAASQMGFDPSETVVIEDSVTGVLAAKRAGMRVFGFTGGGHAYGSLASRLSEAGAVHVCRSMEEVTDRPSSRSLV